MKNKLILHILEAPFAGGCETLSLNFIKHTPELEHAVLFLSGFEGDFKNEFLDLSNCSLPFINTRGKSGELSFVKNLIREIKPFGIIIWIGGRLPYRLHCLSNFDGNVVVHVGNPVVSKFISVRFYLSSLFLNKPSKVHLVCCSNHVHNSIKSRLYFKDFQLSVIHNAVEIPARGYICNSIYRHKLVYIGRIDKIKDIATIIRAVHLFNSMLDFKISVDIIGSGPDKLRLENLVSSLKIDEYVKFRGAVINPFASLDGYDFLVFPATEAEGFGLVLAEALAYGVPVISSLKGPVKEFQLEGIYPFRVVDYWCEESLVSLFNAVYCESPSSDSMIVDGRNLIASRFSLNLFISSYLERLGFN